jgi:hypothetical protein
MAVGNITTGQDRCDTVNAEVQTGDPLNTKGGASGENGDVRLTTVDGRTGKFDADCARTGFVGVSLNSVDKDIDNAVLQIGCFLDRHAKIGGVTRYGVVHKAQWHSNHVEDVNDPESVANCHSVSQRVPSRALD